MKTLIEKCKDVVEDLYHSYDASHDFDHIQRVLKNAEEILLHEPSADRELVIIAVLLHDVEDIKYQTEDGPKITDILHNVGANEQLIEKVVACIESVSFNGGNSKEITSIEGAIVRDADRLDAIGAIGIARAFAFGGARGRKLYDKNEAAREQMSAQAYRTKKTATVTHFYEKLLLLKDLMVTEAGKRLAQQRHDYMIEFLQQLEEEIGE
ncbi:HD domain-containing protein [Sporosarcina sp. HYO08]|uniref:HD domain-containing protein n=1 Tax=Sporosarcina sp. HYO08 TaxID=1759557 RepID=UPI00079B136E|nr:HD domain-containing protein [Sporosarcina sp. HYO08]KXH81965.1 phosphohydrolase [Sporosarcina sp. HYO08]